MMDTVHDNGPKKLELHVGERIFLKLFCLIFRISPWFLEVTEVDSLILILPVKGKILEYPVFIGKTRKAYIYWLGTMYK